MSLPFDSDGFLRRACPTCKREFKWFPSARGHGGNVVAVGRRYFCPYCDEPAPDSSWLTPVQVALAQNMVRREVAAMVKGFANEMVRIGHGSNELVSASMQYDSDELDPLTEADDMRRVDFECHPDEPAKVLDHWHAQTYCLVCGAPT